MLALALAAWALLSYPSSPAGPASAALVFVAILGWGLGSSLAQLHPALPGVAAGAVVTVAMLLTLPGSLLGRAAAAPTGYANANAALLTGAVCGLLVAAGHVWHDLAKWRVPLVAAAVVLSLATVAMGSRAGMVTCLLLFLVWPQLNTRSDRLWQWAGGALVAAAVTATMVLGATYGSESAHDLPVASATGVPGRMVEAPIPTAAGTMLSDARITLWSDALHAAEEHPVRGVGAGNFAEHSVLAAGDHDLSTPHSLPMQVLAELGVVGLLLLVLLVCWLVVALGRGAVLLGVLALQPSVDYVLNFPSVVALFAVVLGAVSAVGIGKPGLTPPSP